MPRLLIIVVLLGLSLFIGSLLNEKQKRKLAVLNGLCSGINELRLRLKFNNASIFELADELARQDNAAGEFWQKMQILLSEGKSVSDAATESANVTLYFCGKDVVEIVIDLFDLFGTADADTELKRLDLACMKLNKITEAFAIECPKQIKLTKAIAALGGAAFVLMII